MPVQLMKWLGMLRRPVREETIFAGPPDGHYPDLSAWPDPDRALLACCGRCRVRMFKTAGGVWKNVYCRDNECR